MDCRRPGVLKVQTLRQFITNCSKSFDDIEQVVNCFMEYPAVMKLAKSFDRAPDSQLLFQSLTHSSLLNESALINENSERLEFLGDAVLELIMTEHIYHRFPHFKEGEMSKLRGALVNETHLAKLARSLELGACLLMGKGEEVQNGEDKDGLLCDAIESILAACFLSHGLESAKKTLWNWCELFQSYYNEDFIEMEQFNSYDCKTKLQEWAMKEKMDLPQYKSTELESGQFFVELSLQDRFYSSVTCLSKKKAQKILAKEAIEKLEV